MAIQQNFQNDSKGATASGSSSARPNSQKNNKQHLEGGFGKLTDPNSQTARGSNTIGKGGGDVNMQKHKETNTIGKGGGDVNAQTIRNAGMKLGKGTSDVNSQTSKESNSIGKGGGDVNSQKVKGSQSIE
jgi:hypothetical protein